MIFYFKKELDIHNNNTNVCAAAKLCYLFYVLFKKKCFIVLLYSDLVFVCT